MSGTKTYVKPGDVITVELPYSEVCMHMKVAGKPMKVRIDEGAYGIRAQLIDNDGRAFSFPVLPGEAGILRDEQGDYAYALAVE